MRIFFASLALLAFAIPANACPVVASVAYAPAVQLVAAQTYAAPLAVAYDACASASLSPNVALVPSYGFRQRVFLSQGAGVLALNQGYGTIGAVVVRQRTGVIRVRNVRAVGLRAVGLRRNLGVGRVGRFPVARAVGRVFRGGVRRR